MKEILISCNGFDLDNLHIPPFDLSTGEVVSLLWPLPCCSIEEQAFADIISGIKPHPAVRINAKPFRIHVLCLRDTLFGSKWLASLFGRLGDIPFRRKYLGCLPWGFAAIGDSSSSTEYRRPMPIPHQQLEHVKEISWSYGMFQN